MSNRNVASLTFIIAGVYVLTRAFDLVSTMAYVLSSNAESLAIRQAGFALRLLLAAYLGLSAILILGHRRLADRVFPEAPEGQNRERLLGLHAFVYSVVGLAAMAAALPGLVSAFAVLAYERSLFGAWQQWPWSLAGAVAQFVLGLALFFGSHWLVRFWSRLRHAGLRRKMGLCERCGYDLMGNTSGTCPECGAAVTGPVPEPPRVLLSDETMREAERGPAGR